MEDTEQDGGLIYRQMGRKRLEGFENVGPRLAEVVQDLLDELSVDPSAGFAPPTSQLAKSSCKGY